MKKVIISILVTLTLVAALSGCMQQTGITPVELEPLFEEQVSDVTALAGKKVSEIIKTLGKDYEVSNRQGLYNAEFDEVDAEYEIYTYKSPKLSFIKLKDDEHPLYIDITHCKNIKGSGIDISTSRKNIQKLLGKPAYSYEERINAELPDVFLKWGYKLKSNIYLEFVFRESDDNIIEAIYIKPAGIPGVLDSKK